jgi:hypothetical protein
MMFLGTILRMIGMAVVLAVLSFGSSAANAHSGHQHQAVHHESVASIAVASTDQAVLSAAAEAKLDQDGDRSSPERPCLSGCCSSASGPCCPSGLPSVSLSVPYLQIVSRVSFPPSQAGVRRTPESFERPPRASL